MSHEFQGFFENERYPVFDVSREIDNHLVVQNSDTDGLSDISDVVGVPGRHAEGSLTASKQKIEWDVGQKRPLEGVKEAPWLIRRDVLEAIQDSLPVLRTSLFAADSRDSTALPPFHFSLLDVEQHSILPPPEDSLS